LDGNFKNYPAAWLKSQEKLLKKGGSRGNMKGKPETSGTTEFKG
jgi:hypothetical protein